MKIQKVETELYHVPLAQPMVDAIHGEQKDFSLVVVKITTDDGAEGMHHQPPTDQAGRIRQAVGKLIGGGDKQHCGQGLHAELHRRRYNDGLDMSANRLRPQGRTHGQESQWQGRAAGR